MGYSKEATGKKAEKASNVVVTIDLRAHCPLPFGRGTRSVTERSSGELSWQIKKYRPPIKWTY
jgi:hypothetical protein